MKYFLYVCFLLSFTSTAMAQTKPEWFSCNNDKDCVVVGSGCTASAVNRLYEDEADSYFTEMNQAIDCEYDPSIEHAKAICASADKKCTLVK